jgi:hypothetical protein
MPRYQRDGSPRPYSRVPRPDMFVTLPVKVLKFGVYRRMQLKWNNPSDSHQESLESESKSGKLGRVHQTPCLEMYTRANDCIL